MQSTCKKTFKHLNSPKTRAKGESVPLWTDALKMRKRTNALRRRCQRTLNNEELRENGKNRYSEEKNKYETAMRKAKINSWNQYCDTTSPSNRWNEAFELASGKTRNIVTLSTLQKRDGSKTANIIETVMLIIE